MKENKGNKKKLIKRFLSMVFAGAMTLSLIPINVFAAAEEQEMLRLYNPNSGEHFYTARAAERDHLVDVGWTYEGVGWVAPARSSIPVYRLYNPNAGDHHYTTAAGERDHLVKVGWRDEGIGWYSDEDETLPLYRQYNPNARAGAHNFTANKAENDHLVSLGWREEGIGWYGLSEKKSEPVTQFTITYILGEGLDNQIVRVNRGEQALVPGMPKNKDLKFIGWFEQIGYSDPFDYSQPVERDITLYAKWFDAQQTEDTDGDGMPDSFEAALGTSSDKEDTDGDGLSDYFELNYLELNPTKRDTDENGITDDQEDTDGDGLTNAEEADLKTDPSDVDTDGDSVSDYDEVKVYGTDPLNQDTDGDGFHDGVELDAGGNPGESEQTLSISEEYVEDISESNVSVDVQIEVNNSKDTNPEIGITDATENPTVLMNGSVPGLIAAYDFTSEAGISSGNVTFHYDPADYNSEEFEPGIFYLNEKNGFLEEVSSTDDGEGNITGKISHFSTYALVDKKIYNEYSTYEAVRAGDAGNINFGPKDIVLTFDTSHYMTEYDPSMSAKVLGKALAAELLGEQENNVHRIAVISHRDSYSVLQNFTQDLEAVNKAIDSITYADLEDDTSTHYGGLLSSLCSWINENKEEGAERNNEIVFFSSKIDTPSISMLNPVMDSNARCSAFIFGGAAGSLGWDGVEYVVDNTGGIYVRVFSEIEGSLTPERAVEKIFTLLKNKMIDSNADGINDYYTELINDGTILTTTLSASLVGVTDMFGEDNPDWDNDGLLNGEELEFSKRDGKLYCKVNSDPLSADTDGDGFTDAEEKQAGTNPRSGSCQMFNAEGQEIPYQDSYNYLYNDRNYDYYYFMDSQSGNIGQFVFDYHKTEKARKTIIDFTSDFAPQDTIEKNKEAIEKQKSREKFIEVLSEYDSIAKNIYSIGKGLADSSTSANEDEKVAREKLNKVKDEVNSARKEFIEGSAEKGNLETIKNYLSKDKSVLDSVQKFVDGCNESDVWKRFVKSLNFISAGLSTAKKFGKDFKIPVGKKLKSFMDTKIGKFETSTCIDLVFDVVDAGLAITEYIDTYSKIEANTDAFILLDRHLAQGSKNGFYNLKVLSDQFDYVKSAYTDVRAKYVDEVRENWVNPILASTGKEIGITALEETLKIGGKSNPYLAVINAASSILKATLKLTGVSTECEGLVQFQTLSVLSKAIKGSFKDIVQTSSNGIAISKDATTVLSDLAQLSQIRYYGEKLYCTMLQDPNLLSAINKAVNGDPVEAYSKKADEIETHINNLNLVVSEELLKLHPDR